MILKVILTVIFELSNRVDHHSDIEDGSWDGTRVLLSLAVTGQYPLPFFMTTAIMAMITVMTAQHPTVMMTTAIRAMTIMVALTSVMTMIKMLMLLQAQTRDSFGLSLKHAVTLSFSRQRIPQQYIITALEDVFVFREWVCMMTG